MRKTTKLWVFTAILMPLLTHIVAAAPPRYFLRHSNNGPNSCKETEWTVKSLDPICTNNQCALSLSENLYKKKANLTLKHDCFISGTVCDVSYERDVHSYTFLGINEMVYMRPWPSIYALDSLEFQNGLSDLLSGKPSSYDFSFFPRKSSLFDPKVAEKYERSQFEINHERYAFGDVQLENMGPGRAVCRVNKRPWGQAPPDHCVVTRLQFNGQEYVLGIGHVDYFLRGGCPQSMEIRIESLFTLSTDLDKDTYVKFLLKKLQTSNIRLDTQRLLVEHRGSEVVITGAAGPRPSTVDEKLNEQFDLTLRVKSSEDGRLSVSQNGGYYFQASIAAWVNSLNTSQHTDWHMPEDDYYTNFQHLLFETIASAYNEFCKNQNRSSKEDFIVDEFDNQSSVFNCK